MTSAPPDFAEAFDTSLPGPAFSNNTDGDAWMHAWCRTCVHQDETGDGCALVDVARIDRIPAAWIDMDSASPRNKYLCQCWTPAAGYIRLIEHIEDSP